MEMTMTNPEMTYYSNGQIKTIIHRNAYGKYHNDKGPAYIQYNEDGQKDYEGYFKDGNLHNLTGPAFIRYFKNGQKERDTYYIEYKWVDGNKLIKELGINPDYCLWTDDEKDMFKLHMMLEVS